MNAMTTTSHGRHGSLRDETATVKSAALVLRQKQLDERASSCKSYISYVRTGVWINNIWASEDTWLALVQMALIRLFMIWPLKLIAPSSFAFAAWRFTSLFSPQEHPARHLSKSSKTGPQSLLIAALQEGLKQLFSFWMTSEAFFFLYYLWKRRRLQAPAKPPTNKLEPMGVLKKTLEATDDIQACGKILDLPGLSSMCQSPTLSPASSVPDILALLPRSESNVEHLLREWGSLPSSPKMKSQKQEWDHWQSVMEDAEVLAIKRAEISGWFLRRGLNQRWPVSRVMDLRRGNLAEWFAWAFFHSDPDKLPADKKHELEKLIYVGCQWVSINFRKG